MIARLTVQRGPTTEYPLAERTHGGWQNGVTFYPDADVTAVQPLQVQPATRPESMMSLVESAVMVARCQECGSELATLAPIRLTHHEDGSHTAIPDRTIGANHG